ncbi:MAG: B12-binding domain-containing radical SAM protein [Candidatus Omnitrophica bacterium]|nr:B12-binding domain-containing radical SAM protein [Candidatus Omnitrophota bacterium]MBU1811382.1 B12-binding domain-containing radical SAM protein [Candidatus Omnitrophota bacterium]
MKLALVFNPFSYKIHEENLRIVQKYFGLFPPLSLAWVASIAERAGHQVIIVDARTLRLSKEDVLDRLKEFKPDILGFMMTTYMYRDTLEWIRFLKPKLKVPVVIGGYNLRVYPRESIVPQEINFGVVEQAYYTIPALLSELEGRGSFSQVPGLVYKDNGNIKITSHSEKINFNDFPNPARHLLPNELYAEFPTERKNFTVMVTSLGCPRKCTFCEAGGTSYSPRSPMTVVNEMQECCQKYNIREIDIFDYEFPWIKERTLAICKEIQKRNLDIIWACRSRIDSVDEELLREMKKSGCSRIYYGVESGNQEILDRINKDITIKQIKETIKLTKKAGIKALGFFLIGAPGETHQTVKNTVKFAQGLDFDYVQFSKVLAKPLTGMWKEMVKNTGRDYWKNWILGKEEDRELLRPWTSLTNQEIDHLTKWAYVRFHSRFKFLVKSALKVRSISEFFRKFFGYLEMVFAQEKVSKKAKRFVAYNENWKKLSFYSKIAKWRN